MFIRRIWAYSSGYGNSTYHAYLGKLGENSEMGKVTNSDEKTSEKRGEKAKKGKGREDEFGRLRAASKTIGPMVKPRGRNAASHISPGRSARR